MHVVKQGFTSVTDAGEDPITLSPSGNYISSLYEIKKNFLTNCAVST